MSHLAQINHFGVRSLKPLEHLHRKPPFTSITVVHCGHSYFENWCFKISTVTPEDMLLTNFGVIQVLSGANFANFPSKKSRF